MDVKAIINGNIFTMASKSGKSNATKVPEEIKNGVIVIENGKIKAIGSASKVKVPKGAEVIDAKGKLVLPGFVEPHSHIGMCEEGIGFEGSDHNEITDHVTPNLRGLDGVYPFDTQFAESREGGITSVVTGPGSANIIGGTFVALKTAGTSVDKMVIKEPVAMKCAFGENPKRIYGSNRKYPYTRMGIAASLRETLAKAKEYAAKKKAAGKDIMKQPPYDAKLEAMIPVVERKLPLKIHAHRSDDIQTAMRIVKEFNLKATLDHCTEGHLIVDDVKASGLSAIIGPSFGVKVKYELRNKSFETPAILTRAGVKVAIMTDCPVHPQYQLPLFAAMAMNAGMSRDEALRAITINAAEITGIGDRVGSLEPGKDADVVIWNKDPFGVDKEVYMTMIDGEVVYKK